MTIAPLYFTHCNSLQSLSISLYYNFCLVWRVTSVFLSSPFSSLQYHSDLTLLSSNCLSSLPLGFLRLSLLSRYSFPLDSSHSSFIHSIASLVSLSSYFLLSSVLLWSPSSLLLSLCTLPLVSLSTQTSVNMISLQPQFSFPLVTLHSLGSIRRLEEHRCRGPPFPLQNTQVLIVL